MSIPGLLSLGRKAQYAEIKDGESSTEMESFDNTSSTAAAAKKRRHAIVVATVVAAVGLSLLLPKIQSRGSAGGAGGGSKAGTGGKRSCTYYHSPTNRGGRGKNNSSTTAPPPRFKLIQTSLTAPNEQWKDISCHAANAPPSMMFPNEAVIGANVGDDADPAFPSRPPVLGFGGAFTEATSLNFHSLSEEGRRVALELLFGRDGLGYSLGRVHMNSCDFCEASYNFDNVTDDFDLVHFDENVTHDVENGMIPLMCAAADMVKAEWPDTKEGLRILASPWSPPPWMKAPTPNDAPGAVHAESMIGSHTPSCLRGGVESKYARSWALFFTKFITAYKKHSVPLWAITVQNEPEFPAPWDACAYTAPLETTFIGSQLGPLLSEHHPEIQLFAFDHNKDHAPHWSDTISADKNASDYTDGIAVHWYAGGMDRLLDGAVGTPNMHKLMARSDKPVLGSEACHCPSTGYAGGDLLVSWHRAERYGHAILADLNAGSNGWIDWNMILDSIGGPNHVNNVCDAPILAVPHRAKNNASSTIPPQQPWEHGGYPFGTPVGDERPTEELNGMGISQKYLDVGLAVQPMYYYLGHITKFVRPGSRVLRSHVEAKGVFGGKGGDNNLARIGVEVTVWPCETSTRQIWKFNSQGQFQVFGHDWQYKPTTSCLGSTPDDSFGGLTLVGCDADSNPGSYQLVNGRFLLKNENRDDNKCLIILELENEGGAGGVRSGSQVTIGDCHGENALWTFDEKTGEVLSGYFGRQKRVCMTTGWPFLQVAAFNTSSSDEGKNTIVILNEADEKAKYVISKEKGQVFVRNSIPGHSIQTIMFD